MRHPATLAIGLAFALPAASFARTATPGPLATSKKESRRSEAQGAAGSERSKGAAPDRAELAQRRFSLLDSLEGWRALGHAQTGLGELAGKLDALKAKLIGIELAKDPKAAQLALAEGGEAFEKLKAELLAALYAAKHDGSTLADASSEDRASFEALTASQADALRELARQPVAAPKVAALQSRVLGADADQLESLFDNGLLHGRVEAGPVAQAFAPVAPAPTLSAARMTAPSGRGAAASVRAQEFFRVPGAQLATGRGAGPVLASYAPSEGPIEVPRPGDNSTGAKQSWQRELLRRTGLDGILSSVGVNAERFIRMLTGAESNYATDATSSAGAAGIMQVMPGTARGIFRGARYRQLAREYGLKVYSPGLSDGQIQGVLNRDWKTCALLGILYLEDQARTFVQYASNLGVSINDKAKLAMNMIAGAYNAGPGRVWQAFSRLRRNGLSLADVDPGRSLVPFAETRAYVRKILKGYGFNLGERA